jgi:hypothetical protein
VAYWIRDFQNVKTGASFRVTSDIQYIPPLRRAIAKKLNDPQWEDDNVYKHDAGLDTKFDGFCPGLAVDELQYGRPKAL